MSAGGFDLNKRPENQPPGGQPPPQNPQYGTPPPQNPPYGAPPPPQSPPYAQNPYGAQPPQNPYPQDPYGGQQNPYGGQQPFPNTPYGNQGIGPRPGDVWIRFAARLIDGLIIWIPLTIILFAVVFSSSSTSTGSLIVAGLFLSLIPYAYFVAFEVTQGWTPGKKLLGLSVKGPNGAPKPDLQQSAIRNSFMLLVIIPFYIGNLLYVVAAIVIAVTINSSPTKQGKHDQLAGGTIVMKD